MGDQQDVIVAYAKSKGLKVRPEDLYVEAESAVHEKFERREKIQRLLKDVRQGDIVVCDKIDRWSRDPEFTYRSIREILSAGASFYAIGDQCDPSTNEGDTMLNFRVLFAKEEHKRIKTRMIGTRRILRDKGYYVEGQPPFGYRRAMPRGHKGVEKNILVINEEEAKIIRKAFALCISGYPGSKVCAALNLRRHLLKSIVRNRLYTGQMLNSKGERIQGRHEAIIDLDTFAKAQTAIDTRMLGGPRPRGKPARTSTWILRDVATCGACGARMGANYAGREKVTPRGAEVKYQRFHYICSHRCQPRGYVLVSEIEAAAEVLIVARLEELRDQLATEPKKETPAPTKKMDFVARREIIAKKRAKFQEIYTDDLMSKDELRAHLEKLDAGLLKLDAEEEASKKRNPLAQVRVRRALLRQVNELRRAWRAAKPEAKRKIVGQIGTSVRMERGQPPSFLWRSPEELTDQVPETELTDLLPARQATVAQ